MDNRTPARTGVSLWARLVDAFYGRHTPAVQAVPFNSPEWEVDPDTETWWHLPPNTPAGMQEIRACAPDGYDFARLVWQACEVCCLGLIVKIKVTGPWQRHGYGSRMVRFALRDREGYRWTTTPQSEDARAFFPVITKATGVAFPREHHLCGHMQAGGPRHSRPSQQLDPPPG
ncbi:hypothetical protein [Streptomyces sp. NBC_01462]|uniref:hypothetical protein n=1 Tax=Streptomyces sp. NBC_01462 TaxID=2903876 RepID=UPI002E36FE73|nr:hypothetical protein [Streptomyces sp. NBC_01462]